MTNRSRPLLALSTVAFILACGGNPEPAMPEPAEIQAPPVEAPAATGTLSDERVMEIGRGYAELLYAGNYAQLWEHVSPASQERFGTLERFQGEGERVMSDLGAEVGVISETVEPARAGMQADKLYLRVSHYERRSGTPVRLMVGIKNDGSIAGIQIRPAE